MSDIIDIRKKAESSARREIYKKINSRCKDLPRAWHITAQEFIAICNQSDISFRADVADWASDDARVARPNQQCLELVEKLLNAIDIIEKRDATIAQLKERDRLGAAKLIAERIKNLELTKKLESLNDAH